MLKILFRKCELKNTIYITLFMFFIISCQGHLSPTKVKESIQVDLKEFSQRVNSPIVLDSDVIIVDARSRFEYALSHVRDSININWEEYSQIRSNVPGKIMGDYDRLIKRLSLKGIGKNSKILIVGKGIHGDGSEGRLGWILFYLGLTKIQFASIENFKELMTSQVSDLKENAKPWNVDLNSSIEANKIEVLETLNASQSKKVHLIDVRSKSEYFKKSPRNRIVNAPQLNTIHIEWTEFFQSDGRPNLQIKSKLESIGIKSSDRVIVISKKGVRSSAVTMALLAMGYSRAASFSGGYQEFFSTPNK